MKQKYYVVYNGHRTGIYGTYEEMKAQITGYPNARFWVFDRRSIAEFAMTLPYWIPGEEVIMVNMILEASNNLATSHAFKEDTEDLIEVSYIKGWKNACDVLSERIIELIINR